PALLDPAAQLSLMHHARDHGGHFRGPRPVVPRRSDHLREKLKDVLIEPCPIDRVGIGKRLESAESSFATEEEEGEERCAAQKKGEKSGSCRGGSAEVDRRRKRGAGVPQARSHGDVLAARKIRARDVLRHFVERLPGGIEREV